MENSLFRTALGIALGLCAAAVPGYSSSATTFLTYSGSATGATNSIEVTGSNSSEYLSAFSAPYTTLGISGAPDSADNGTWTINTHLVMTGTDANNVSVFTLMGTFTSCSGCGVGANLTTLPSISLETFDVALPFNTGAGSGFKTNDPTQTTVNVVYGAVTSLSESAAFLFDLQLGGVSSSMTSGGIAGTGTGGVIGTTGTTSIYGFQATSETMGVTLTGYSTAPEPVSFFLLGSGLLGIAWFARKRSIRA